MASLRRHFNTAHYVLISSQQYALTHTILDFLKAANTGEVSTPNFEDGVKNQKVLDAIEKAVESRQWESV